MKGRVLGGVRVNPPTSIAGRTGAVTTFALCATAARALHTRMMRHSHTHMPAPPALSPQSGFARARTPHALWRARGRRSPRTPRIVRAPRWVDAFTTGPKARCERDLFAVPARCLPTPRALCFHVLTIPLVSYRCIYMMMLGKLGEVDAKGYISARIPGRCPGQTLPPTRTTRDLNHAYSHPARSTRAHTHTQHVRRVNF